MGVDIRRKLLFYSALIALFVLSLWSAPWLDALCASLRLHTFSEASWLILLMVQVMIGSLFFLGITQGARNFKALIIEFCFHSSLFWWILGALGCAVTLADPFMDARPVLMFFLLCTACSIAFGWMWKRDRTRKRMAGEITLGLIVVWGSLYMLNGALSFFIPDWPARELHGLPAEQTSVLWQSNPGNEENPIHVNSWGQRDEERTATSAGERPRALLIGDSFLESSSAKPFPTYLQEKCTGMEWINLGVSATAPDEYYYRLKNIGLELEPDQVYIFLYEGNDFLGFETLKSYLGIFAVAPKTSALQWLGLGKVEWIIMQRERPFTRILGMAGEKFKVEQKRKEIFESRDKQAIETMLVDEFNYEDFLQHHDSINIDSLCDVILEVDSGFFRSYNLLYGLSSDPDQQSFSKEDDRSYQQTLAYATAMAKLADDAGVAFKLVIIPDGSQVDPRIQEIWSPFFDLKTGLQKNRKRAEQLTNDLSSMGISVVDLEHLLQGQPGMYLHPDGHFSDLGNQTIAEFMQRESGCKP